MATQYHVVLVDEETGETTVDGPFPTELAAIAFAESRAEAYYGGGDVTWFESVGGEYVVGRISEDGSRSEPLVRITVDEEEVEIDEDPTI